MRVIVGAEAHATVFNALRLLGLGRDTADARARRRARAGCAPTRSRPRWRAATGPAIVCAQAGNVNTGAFDPLEPIVAACRAHGAWFHVDGAFGLWAAAAPGRAHLTAGVAGADSWAVDAHKWLNVPYDARARVRRRPGAAARRRCRSTPPTSRPPARRERNGADWAPEASRRARAFPLYAALRQLGRAGVAELVERHCALAARIAERLAAEPGVAILNDVVLNQVLVRFGDDDEATDASIARVQRDGTCWLGGTRWHGMAAMRISVSGWRTTEADVDRCAEAILGGVARPDRVARMLIEGARALVCGGASGLGAATARRLRAAGARVTIADVDAEQGEALAERARRRAFVALRRHRRGRRSTRRSTPRAAPGRCGSRSRAPASAGRRRPRAARPARRRAVPQVIEVNLLGTFHLLRAAGAAMLGNEPDDGGEAGVIVMTASIAAFDGQIGQLAYAASKGGVVGMTLPAARDLAGAGSASARSRPGCSTRRCSPGCPRRRAPRWARRCRTPRGSGDPTSTRRWPRTSSGTRCSTARPSASTARCACRRAERRRTRFQSQQLRFGVPYRLCGGGRRC